MSHVSVNSRDRKMMSTWEIRKPKSFYKAKEMLVTDDTANATASGSGNQFTNTNTNRSTIESPNASILSNTNTNTNSNASRANFTFHSNSNSDLQQEQVQDVNPDSSIVWNEAEPNQIFPLDCIQNVSAHVPDKCATVETTYVKNLRMSMFGYKMFLGTFPEKLTPSNTHSSILAYSIPILSSIVGNKYEEHTTRKQMPLV